MRLKNVLVPIFLYLLYSFLCPKYTSDCRKSPLVVENFLGEDPQTPASAWVFGARVVAFAHILASSLLISLPKRYVRLQEIASISGKFSGEDSRRPDPPRASARGAHIGGFAHILASSILVSLLKLYVKLQEIAYSFRRVCGIEILP